MFYVLALPPVHYYKKYRSHAAFVISPQIEYVKLINEKDLTINLNSVIATQLFYVS
jgi:hypothetical protein